MTRLSRTLLNSATTLSFLLCIASILLNFRSHHQIDSLTLSKGTILSTWLGGLHYYTMTPAGKFESSLSRVPLPPNLRWDGAQYNTSPRHQFHGFIIVPKGQMRSSGGVVSLPLPSYTAVRIPLWAATIATSILPAIRIIRCLRRYRKIPGICPRCGYDLRATPNQCPECGTIPSNAKS